VLRHEDRDEVGAEGVAEVGDLVFVGIEEVEGVLRALARLGLQDRAEVDEVVVGLDLAVVEDEVGEVDRVFDVVGELRLDVPDGEEVLRIEDQIGRASCRERVS
jgi:hypothetical protein